MNLMVVSGGKDFDLYLFCQKTGIGSNQDTCKFNICVTFGVLFKLDAVTSLSRDPLNH